MMNWTSSSYSPSIIPPYSTIFFSEFNVVRSQVESSLFAKKNNPNLKSLNIRSKYASSPSISTNIGAESMWRSLMYWLRVEQNRVTCDLTESFDSWSMFLIRLSITGDESQGIYGSDLDEWWLGSMPWWQLSRMSGVSSYLCYDSVSPWFDFYRIFRQSLKLYNTGVLQDGTRAFGIAPDPI